MNNNKIFLKISESIESNKLKKTCLSLFKKFKQTKRSELWRVHDLTMTLYFQSKTDEVLLICNELEKIEFNGDFNIWTPIESLLLLKCRILQSKNSEIEFKKTLSKIKVVDTFEWNEGLKTKINRKVRKRRINERTLLKNNDIIEEIELRKLHFLELLFIQFLSNNKTQEIENEIEENEKQIKKLMQHKIITP